MYRKVVIPLDGSKESEFVLDQFREEVEPDGEVILLKVNLPMPSRNVGGGNVILGSQVEEAERAEALAYLNSIAAQREGDSGSWRWAATIASSPAKGIIDFAEREEVDLIAMYTHHRKGLAKMFKGSVASEVERKAHADVKLYTGLDTEPRMVVQAPAAEQVQTDGGQAPVLGVLRDCDLLMGLSDEQIEKVVPLAVQKEFGTGEVLGKSGELGDRIFIIAQGEAQITTHTQVGDIAARIAGPGNTFPAASFTGSGKLVTSAKALTNMKVLELQTSGLAALFSQNPDVGLQVYKNLAELFVDRYGETMGHLARSVERELGDTGSNVDEKHHSHPLRSEIEHP